MSDDASDDDAKPAPAEAAAPTPRRKKRRRAAEAAPAEPPPAPAESAPEKPAFARDFPSDPALDALVAAFEAGDYARVRREAPALAQSTDRDDVRAAARELARRLTPDPVAVYLLALSAVLLAFLAGWYWLHPHGH
jgi:hypothetical protein